MLKKLLKGCLTAAMVTAMAVSVSAETTFTWAGNAEGTLLNKTVSPGGGDAVTTMDMAASGDLDLAVAVGGDQWTGTAYLDLDFDAADTGVDDVYVEMSNDALAISFGEFDPVGIGQGHAYTGEIDESYGAGGNNETPNEQGWLRLKLNDVGLSVFLGMNAETEDDGDDSVAGADEGNYSTTAYGVVFQKSFSIIDLGVQYVALSSARDEADGDVVAEDSKWDGLVTSELAFAVTANFTDMMALTLNYASDTYTIGGDGVDAFSSTYMEIVFDMGLSDTMGFSVAYDMGSENDGSGNDGGITTEAILQATFKLSTGGVDHYIAYYSQSDVTDASSAEANTESAFGYTMKVGF